MSGNPTGSNVVLMPHAQAPATVPPQMPMPMPSMWGGSGTLPWGPGCCPPGGMDALLKCYCDVQAATAFICSVMVQCVQTNPAVVEAIIAAIEKSGSSLPLTGVTNGQAAQPGQVGEFIQVTQTLSFTTSLTTQNLPIVVLQPGDWDCWLFLTNFTAAIGAAGAGLNPVPAGFSNSLPTGIGAQTGEAGTFVSPIAEALLSVPTLVPVYVELQGQTAPGTCTVTFNARRAR